MSKSLSIDSVYEEAVNLSPDFVYVFDKNGKPILDDDEADQIQEVFTVKQAKNKFTLNKWTRQADKTFIKSPASELELEVKNGKFISDDNKPELKIVIEQIVANASPSIKVDTESTKSPSPKPQTSEKQPEKESKPEPSPSVDSTPKSVDSPQKGGKKTRRRKRKSRSTSRRTKTSRSSKRR